MKTKQEIVQPYIQMAEHISPSELIEILDDDVIVIDLRSDAEFNAGHIKGAINMNRGYVETSLADKIPGIKDDTKIILYCHGGGISSMTQVALRNYGYTNVFDITGGINNYLSSGYTLFNILGEFKFVNFGLEERAQ